MKRLILIGFLLAGSGALCYAQTDDIYSSGQDQRNRKHASDNNGTSDNGTSAQNHNNSNSGGDSYQPDNYQNYNNPDDYVDYDDDSYSSRINRFDNSFYNMGYYSTFYNPF